MQTRMIFAALVALALVLGAALGAWYVLRRQSPAFCQISARPIHGNMHTLARVNGETLHACCPRCPLTLTAQTGQKVRLLEVTDFSSGQHLPADRAFYVEASSVHMCSTPGLKVDESRTPYVRLFDRCEPSLVAFASEQDARDFIAQNGGSLKRLEDLMKEAEAPAPPGGRDD